MKVNQVVNRTPRFRVLSEDQIEKIYFSALDVLEDSGGGSFTRRRWSCFARATRW